MKSSHSPQMQLLLDTPIVSMLCRLALPNLVAVTIMTCIFFADAKYVGQLGTKALASLAVVFPFQSLMQMMAEGAMGGGIASSVARALGSGNRLKAEEATWHGLIIIRCNVFLVHLSSRGILQTFIFCIRCYRRGLGRFGYLFSSPLRWRICSMLIFPAFSLVQSNRRNTLSFPNYHRK